MNLSHIEQTLERCLGEDPDSLNRKATTELDQLTDLRREGPIIVHGAGCLGQKLLHGLHELGITVTAFSDNNPALWGQTIEKVPVYSRSDAADKYGALGLFIVAVFSPATGILDIVNSLKALGCARVITFMPVFKKYHELFLPHLSISLPGEISLHGNEIRQAFSLFGDDHSQSLFVDFLKFLQSGDFGSLPQPDSGPQYFPPFLGQSPHSEIFVDCGAYDGDTVMAFSSFASHRVSRIVAYEPDPGNFRKLSENIRADAALAEVSVLRNSAVGSASGTLRFNSTSLPGAAEDVQGDTEVECVVLDDDLEGLSPTFVKMDVEGAEYGALHGARQTPSRAQPVCAICLYH